MLCLKTETLEHDMYPSYGEILRSNFTTSVQKLLLKSERNSTHSKRSLFSSGAGSGSSSGVEDTSIGRVSKWQTHDKKMSVYRSQLERDVERLQKQLQEEIDLHVALASVMEHSGTPSGSPNKLPDKTRQLIANIQVLEMTVLKLEEELVTLHFQLSQERNERRLAEYQLRHLPSITPSPLIYNPTYLTEPISPRISTHSGSRMADLLQLDLVTAVRQSQLAVADQPNIISTKEEDAEPCGRNFQESMGIRYSLSEAFEELNKDFLMKDLWQHPNKLSEEMVKCMRNIFVCLAHSSNITSKLSCSEDIPSPRSPHGILSSSSLASSSDSSLNPSLFRSWSVDSRQSYEGVASVDAFDPYRVDGKLNWVNVGRYSSAVDVSLMSVGKKQLEYAAATLKGFRFLVEQLVKVNPACMRSNEKLAFWINLYNALIMHAYLAYGVPKSEIKFFSLMQKVSYTVGGLSVSAAEIEYNILKMKPPAHRPQIALVLALHKFKSSEEQRTYSVDNPDSIVSFALSCGMYSSPAVRIFTPDDISEQLHESLRDYIQASVGISSKGKLLVPKLLHCYAKGIVEDSLLADWICRYLSPQQASMVRDCTSQRKQRLLGARGFTIVPFDSRFRYLFLVEKDRP
ncbi:hypothetical protein H6P81_015217 [Aristolochia fimbriata]|uniref:Uncharacterized protein n=1 Tax=Aristolochia fimbriata TaxID=158543 RepID=A0AAV7E8N8_ARIFI|nr:hypothetical protein H6P81_015217 [Aristolochia fimbriata]